MIAIDGRRRAALLVGLALVGMRARTTFAQSVVPDKGNDRAAAQSLFDAAKVLMSAGQFEEACPKLAESQRLDPAGGTLLNMGLCYEGQGRLATAWADYKQALAIARRDGRADRVRAAQERIAALEPRLPRITITNSGSATSIALDGRPVGSVEWGTPIPVDPGAHEVNAERPGASPWHTRVELGPAERTVVEVPALRLVSPVAGADAHERAAVGPTADRTRRLAAYALAGTTLVAVGVGTFFGLRAISKHRASDAMCPTNDRCTIEGKQDNDDARAAALVSDVAFTGALVAAGITTYLWYSSRATSSSGSDSRNMVLAPGVGADFAALQVTGTW